MCDSCTISQTTVSSHDVITFRDFLFRFFRSQNNTTKQNKPINRRNKNSKMKNLPFCFGYCTCGFFCLCTFVTNSAMLSLSQCSTNGKNILFLGEKKIDDVTSIASSSTQLLLPFDTYEHIGLPTAYKNVEF